MSGRIGGSEDLEGRGRRGRRSRQTNCGGLLLEIGDRLGLDQQITAVFGGLWMLVVKTMAMLCIERFIKGDVVVSCSAQKV